MFMQILQKIGILRELNLLIRFIFVQKINSVMWTTIYTDAQKATMILHASFWPTFHAHSALQQSVDQKIGAHTQNSRCFYFSRQQNRFSALIWCLSFDKSRLTNLVIDWPFVWVCVCVCVWWTKKERELCWWGAANAFATLKISRKNKRRLSAGRWARFLCVRPLANKRERTTGPTPIRNCSQAWSQFTNHRRITDAQAQCFDTIFDSTFYWWNRERLWNVPASVNTKPGKLISIRNSVDS